MRLQRSIDCLFRTPPNGRRVFYSQVWRGAGVQLRDAAQEAALRRMLGAGLRILLVLILLGYALWLAPGVLPISMAQRETKAAGLVILCLVILGYFALRWRRNQLIKDCPGVIERLTRRDYEVCLAGSLSLNGPKACIAIVLLIAAAGLGLGLDVGLQGDVVTAIPPMLLAAELLLSLQRCCATSAAQPEPARDTARLFAARSIDEGSHRAQTISKPGTGATHAALTWPSSAAPS
jgi:hypothetical protein